MYKAWIDLEKCLWQVLQLKISKVLFYHYWVFHIMLIVAGPFVLPRTSCRGSFEGTPTALPGQRLLALFRTHQLEQCSQNLLLKLALKAILQEARAYR